ncbi:MAG: sigma 54-interacting transcriptional regulator [Planctomycetia bacterium]|nr:sigma 54-interacting transcriptional regulator [Planctomycetia bacterium]
MLFLGSNVERKRLVAHGFHKRGPRAGGPFIRFDCAVRPPQQLAADLLGAARDDDRGGELRAAQGGTLYFEAVHLLPADVQDALVPLIQDRCARPGNGRPKLPVDVWIMATSEVDLREEVAQGRFRADLFALLSTVSIEME